MWRKRILFLTVDSLLLAASLVVAAFLRFDGRIPSLVRDQLPLAILLSWLARMPVFARYGLYALSWSQVSLVDIIVVYWSVTLGSAILWSAVWVATTVGWLAGVPRSILLIDYIIVLHGVGAFRLGRRVYQHLRYRLPARGTRAVIVGAGVAGEQLARSLRQTPSSGYVPVGFIDDDNAKHGAVIQGMRVLGSRAELSVVVGRYGIQAVLIAMPSAPSRVIRHIVTEARALGVLEIRIIPGLDRLLDGQLSFSDLREVEPADLLGREVVRIDTAGVGQWLAGRTVLITGAAGSIGSELCRQVVKFPLHQLVLLDSDESRLFWVEQDLRRRASMVTALVADVRSYDRMRVVLDGVRPDVVFHAAAYKHVALMERHPQEAIRTNILGTRVTAIACAEAGVKKFVLISTDKAVNPTSVMGATKRGAEQVCMALNALGNTRFLAVRFGNVLGSRGSVLPVFQERIRRGEPLTIRGPNMRRYLMAVEEAVLLVLQAGAMGRGGEIFVLDMGEPVRIVEFAREFIRLSGLEPDRDVPIVFADPEPGEKEFEDLLTAEEGTMATRHDRIFIAKSSEQTDPETTLSRVRALETATSRAPLAEVISALQGLVPNYQPSKLVGGDAASLGFGNAVKPEGGS